MLEECTRIYTTFFSMMSISWEVEKREEWKTVKGQKNIGCVGVN